MSPGRQAEYERLFLAASRLKGKERERFLDDACRHQPGVRRSVEILLANVAESGSTRRRAPIIRHETTEIERTVRRNAVLWVERWMRFMQSPAGPLLMLVFLSVTGFFSYGHMREGVERVVEEGLVTSLDDSAADLSRLIESKRSTLEYFASNEVLVREARALIDETAGSVLDADALRDSPRVAAVRGVLDPFMQRFDIHGFWLVDSSGRILVARVDTNIGRHMSAEGMEILEPAFDGEAIVQAPIAEHRLLRGADKTVLFPVTLQALPLVEHEGTVTAVLIVISDPRLVMGRVFRATGVETDWDVFAFDEQARLISETIHLPQLQALGMVPSDAGTGSPLRVQLRDPGGDLTQGFRNDTPPGAWPLTRMAASALAGESGVDLGGYRNLLGIQVLGAWTWIPKHRIGLAVEFRSSKALSLTRPMWLAFAGLFALIVIATVAFAALSYAVKVMRQRMEADQLGQYTLVGKIGEGGMGIVYKARHSMLRRDTALKILRTDIVDTESVARFEREVQVTSQLAHPNTIEIYDYGLDDRTGAFYYAMEYLDGLTLAELLAVDGPQPVARVVHILRQVCGSLAEAHDVGLVHRDVKPLNIMLCERGGLSDVVKVLDFGLVADVRPETNVQLTSAGVVKGTPLYIAPERVLNPAEVDARSDIYSLGTVAYNLLTGKEVFEGRSSTELLDKVLRATPVSPSDHLGLAIDEEVERLVMACLEKEPEKRPASMRAILEILESLQSVPRWTQEQARAWWSVHHSRHGTTESLPGTQATQDSDTAEYSRPD